MPATCRQPNVILVITDDQGYGDLGCTGNPWLRTPHIDAFHDDGLRLTDFHVAPLCTPTRGAIMSGHRPLRNGAWATTWGRSILDRGEITMADIFRANGYRTGLFGKWHLGDNYPYRPQDRGFETVVAHRGGGVGQTPDYWGNNYFDDTYFHNGKPVGHEGYCTDVWFSEAMAFIEAHHDRPFFAYLATNAPHDPYLVAERYAEPYRGIPGIPQPAFYGMISNIDENFGGLRRKLAELGIEDRTILVFMTDNGSSGGARLDASGHEVAGFNAGLRGMKASYYDGGHRVPFFIRWPDGGFTGGFDVGEMALDVDLVPTFAALCNLSLPARIDFDGTSLARVLRRETDRLPADRIHFLQYRQSASPPEKWTNAVITRQWRLVNGQELFDIKADPRQCRDVAARHPDVVARLRGEHERWWTEIAPSLERHRPITIGSDRENPARLDAFDMMGDVAWPQAQVALAAKTSGRWAVDVEKPGRYRFELRRWPAELSLAIDAGIDEDAFRSLAHARGRGACVRIEPRAAGLRLFGQTHARAVGRSELAVVFEVDVKRAGETCLDAWFVDAAGETRGAYYVYVERLPT